MTVERLCHGIALLLASYLLLRAAAHLLRLRWAHRAYPVTPEPAAIVIGAPAGSDLHDRARGALLGAALGDSLGLPAESLPPWLIRLRYPSGPRPRRGLLRLQRSAGEISDDTQLLICVARSIDTSSGRYLHERFLDELRLWHGYRIAAGRACSRAAALLRVDPARPSGQPSEGNGAAMRIAPLALARAHDPDPGVLLAEVEENARTTHTAPLAVAGARLVALLLWHALRAPGSTGPLALRAALPALCGESGFALELALAARAGPPSGRISDTIAAVLAPLLDPALDRASSPRAGFEEVLTTIFAAGGDVDTVASIACSILGARHGTAALPAAWLASLRHRVPLTALAGRLIAARVARTRVGVIDELEGELALREVDAVVNAWNRNVIPAWLLLPQGVSGAIRRHGGRGAIREISRRAPMPLGSAWETGAGELPSRWVIHVAGIDLLWRGSPASVARSARNALLLARCLGAASVALPLIGAGSGGLPATRARAILLAEMQAQRGCFDRLELVHRRRLLRPACSRRLERHAADASVAARRDLADNRSIATGVP